MDLFISQFQLILSFTIPEKIKIEMGTTHVCMFITVNHHNIILIDIGNSPVRKIRGKIIKLRNVRVFTPILIL